MKLGRVEREEDTDIFMSNFFLKNVLVFPIRYKNISMEGVLKNWDENYWTKKLNILIHYATR